MKAAVLYGPGDIRIEPFQSPEIEAGHGAVAQSLRGHLRF